MGLLHKPGETIPFSPEGSKVVYHLRVPAVYDRVAYRRAMGEHNAQQHGQLALLGALRRGAELIMADSADDQRDFILGAIDAQIARQEAFNAAVIGEQFDTQTEDGRTAFMEAFAELGEGGADLREIEGLVTRGYAPYRAMMGDNATFWSIAGIEAARLFLEGCDGLDGFARGRQGTDEAFLALIPETHLPALAQKVQSLLNPSEADAKNSVSPSGSQSGAAISKASKTRPRKSRSKAISGT